MWSCRPEHDATPRPGVLFTAVIATALLAGVAGPASAQLSVTDSCMQTIYNRYNGTQTLQCTANDVRITGLTNVTVIDGCDFPGDTATFSADAIVELTAEARYDIGLYLATDGGNALTGSCEIGTLPTDVTDLDGTTNTTDNKFGYCGTSTTSFDPAKPCNDDGDCSAGTCQKSIPAGTQDSCGDIDDAPNPIVTPIGTITFACVDNNGDGKADLPNCTSWRQPGDNQLCTTPLAAFPGAPSKCNCGVIDVVEIAVPKAIKVVKDLVPATDAGRFDLQIDGTTYASSVGDGGTTEFQPVDAGAHTVGELGAGGTALSAYSSSIACVDTVGRCSEDAALHCVSDSVCAAAGAGTCDTTPTPAGSCADCTSLAVTVPDAQTAIVCTVTNTNKCAGVTCNDGNVCTIDACEPTTGECTYTPGTGPGFEQCDAGDCVPERCPATACQDPVCNPDNTCGTPVNDDTNTCTDGNACTTDTCSAGACVSTTITCDDGDACTTDSCDPDTGCETAPVTCDDGNACTEDSCDSADGCQYDAVTCDDGTFCNGEETCDPATGCQAGTPVACDDGIACTADRCDESIGACAYAPDNTLCDNGIVCDGTEVCDPANGCQTGAPLVCDDDGSFCNGEERCDEASGGCVSSGDPCPAGGECAACNEDDDTCFAPAGTPCGDPSDTLCTNPDTCDGDGTCLPNNEQCGSVTANNRCGFDQAGTLPGQQFRVNFLADSALASEYTLTSASPGGFYFNTFVDGAPGSTVDVSLFIPWPFVTRGTTPVSVSDASLVTVDDSGRFECIVPPIPIARYPLRIAVNDWRNGIPGACVPGQPCVICPQVPGPDGTATSDQCTIQVPVTIPASGSAYVAVHLQYGLIKSPDMNPVDGSADRYDRGAGDDALVNTTPDGTGAVALPDPATYEFGYQVGPDYLAVPVGSINRFRVPTTAPTTTAPESDESDPK